METCQIREQRTPQKRRGAISAEVYTEEEVKNKKNHFNKNFSLKRILVLNYKIYTVLVSDFLTILRRGVNQFTEIFYPSHIKLSNNNSNKDLKSVKRP